MKICYIVPRSADDRKFAVVTSNISIPSGSQDYGEFLQTITDEILEIMASNSVSSVKIAFGADLPEYYLIIDIVAEHRTHASDRETICGGLMSIIETPSPLTT